MLKASGGHPEMESFREHAISGTLQYGRLKESVAEVIISMTETFKQKRQEIASDKVKYQESVAASSQVIRKRAQETVREVKDLIGLMNVPLS